MFPFPKSHSYVSDPLFVELFTKLTSSGEHPLIGSTVKSTIGNGNIVMYAVSLAEQPFSSTFNTIISVPSCGNSTVPGLKSVEVLGIAFGPNSQSIVAVGVELFEKVISKTAQPSGRSGVKSAIG